MDILDLSEELKHVKYNGVGLNLDERYQNTICHYFILGFNSKWLCRSYKVKQMQRSYCFGERSKVGIQISKKN